MLHVILNFGHVPDVVEGGGRWLQDQDIFDRYRCEGGAGGVLRYLDAGVVIGRCESMELKVAVHTCMEYVTRVLGSIRI